jgi:hypothetical protein
MNEEQFRARMRGALGEPPSSDLRRGLEARLTAGSARPRSSVLGPLAAILALLTIAGAVGWRLAYQRTSAPATVKQSTATAAPTVAPTAVAVDPLNCRLPVVIMRESGPPGQITTEAGFVDTRSGQYVKDNSASIAGLPGGAFEGTDVKPFRAAAPAWYSDAVKRWLPVGSTLVAPDGRSYIWTRFLPAGSNIANFKRAELHRYDITTATDHLLWSYAGYINVHRWDAAGILVDTTPPPPAGGTTILWLIDPQTGTAAEQPYVNQQQGPTMLPGEGQNGAFSWGSFGTDAQGRTIYRIGSRQAGDQEWVFYESAPGQRVTIYKGQQGDATGFDPGTPMGDGRGIWFSDYETRGLWYWDPASGLHKLLVKGLPTQLAGPNSSVYVDPSGSCM